jgi:ubiquinone/menaquinone biosynthesis C-methylase UbiE
MSSHFRVENFVSKSPEGAPAGDPMYADWSAYATAYDLLSEYNPAYQALLQDFESFITTIEPPRVIYDIGGGTGNYTQIAARTFPESDIHLVEPDPAMIQKAHSKLFSNKNVSFENQTLEEFKAQGPADLVICVHALYAMTDQEQRLSDLRQLLRPGGHLYLIDLGRYMNVADWRGYLFAELKSRYGLIMALRVFWQGRQVAKQNKTINKAQKTGAYWTHSEAEIASAATAAGFNIIRQEPVYRGYSDLLVCRTRP